MDGTDELSEKEIIRAERNSGVVSGRVREIQVSRSMNSASPGLSAEMCSVVVTQCFFLLTTMSEKKNCAQLKNYQKKMEQKMQREEDLRMGLRLYKSVA